MCCLSSPGASVSTSSSSGRPSDAVLLALAGDDEDRVGVLDAGDVGLRAAQHVARRSSARRGRELVRVRPASGSVIANATRVVPGGDPGSQSLALLLGAVPDEDRADDRRRDDDQQQRAAGGRDLLADRRQRAHPEPAAAVLLGQVDAEVALLGERVPQLASAARPASTHPRMYSGRRSPRRSRAPSRGSARSSSEGTSGRATVRRCWQLMDPSWSFARPDRDMRAGRALRRRPPPQAGLLGSIMRLAAIA